MTLVFYANNTIYLFLLRFPPVKVVYINVCISLYVYLPVSIYTCVCISSYSLLLAMAHGSISKVSLGHAIVDIRYIRV